MKKVLLFVYGSLKHGFYNHRYISRSPHSRYKGEFTTEAKYTMLDLGIYPAVVEGGTTAITGELWEVGFDGTYWAIQGLEASYNEVEIQTPLGPAKFFIKPRQYQSTSIRLRLEGSEAIVSTGVWTLALQNKYHELNQYYPPQKKFLK
jgi:gamma-glutamylcyclotransferase (GGCT)/AIG2-like uncharacterized protein YtfP